MDSSLKNLEEKYDLELERIVKEIVKVKKKNAVILLQFPDGMKQYSTEIADFLSERTGADIRIWLGSCFGACDTPRSDADLVIQFGHAAWKD